MALLPKIRKGKKTDGQNSVEVGEVSPKVEDSFDILPKITPVAKKSPPVNLLSVDKVAAVRFHRVKNGYSYEQVEAFVEQIKMTLQYLEGTSYDQKTEIHTFKQEVNDLDERLQTLQATIEVFRANGDPILKEDGSYLTHSEIAPLDDSEMTLKIRELESKLDGAIVERDNAIDEAKRAWGEEGALRKYLEEDLLPWIKSQEDIKVNDEEIVKNTSTTAVEITVAEPVIEVATPVVEATEPVVEVTEPAIDIADTQSVVEVAAPVVDNDDWDSYSVEPGLIESEIGKTQNTAGQTKKNKTATKRKDILFDSPEVAMLEEAGENIEIIEDTTPEKDVTEFNREPGSPSPLLAIAPEVVINEFEKD